MHNTSTTNFPLRKTLLALTIGALSQGALAADGGAKKNQEDTLVVRAEKHGDFNSGGNDLVPAYLDGQVAHGGRLGMLGEQKAMDVPFNVIGYTSEAGTGSAGEDHRRRGQQRRGCTGGAGVR